MYSEPRHLSTATMVLIAILAGCTAPYASMGSGPIPYRVEWARYDVRVGDIRTTVDVNVSWLDSHVQAVSLVDNELTEFNLSKDTGELLEIRGSVPSEDWTLFPWGVNRVMPSLQAFSPENPAWVGRLAAALGPQWTILGSDHYSGSWGDGTFASDVGSEGWTIEARAFCQTSCPQLDGDDNRLAMTMHGAGPGILPQTVDYSFGSLKANVTRTMHGVAGQKVDVVSRPPIVSANPVGIARCDYLPCEPATWPASLSLQAGLDGLFASPQWLAWKEKQTRPFYLSAASLLLDGRTAVGDIALDESTIWFFSFINFDEETRFQVKARHLPTGAYATPLVLDPETTRADTLGAYFRASTFSLPTAEMSTALQVISESAGRPLEQVTRLEFAVLPAEVHPDNRASMIWAAYWGPFGAWDTIAQGSAFVPQPFSVTQITYL